MPAFKSLGWQVLVTSLTLGAAGTAHALPIGFGVNQGKLKYDEVQSPHFVIYHDARVPGEGQMVLNALEAVRPSMERWFGKKREQLPIVMSAVTENASFANFITDAIELQTMGQSTKELAWHEYTHATMYEHYRNWFGHAGSIIHLPWMPAWFLEGLAESMSVSVGSDVTAGIERYQALSGNWPSYDRLHSLYNSSFSERGYATSGAFTSWFLRQGRADDLPKLLDNFYDYTLPWWWPITIVPWKSYLPMDRAIRDYVQVEDGDVLYANYKKAAAEHWQSISNAPFLYKTPGKRRAIGGLRGIRAHGNELYSMTRNDDGELYEMALKFNETSGWADAAEERAAVPEGFESYAGVTSTKLRVGVEYEPDVGSADHSIIHVRGATKSGTTKSGAAKKDLRTIKRSASVFDIYEGPKHLAWVEQAQETTRLCVIAEAQLDKKAGGAKPKVTCPYVVRQPKTIRVAGSRGPGNGQTREIWIDEAEEKLTGSVHRLRVFDLATLKFKRDVLTTPARPAQVAFAGKDTWVLMAERSQRTLRRIDANGQCQGMLTFKDHLLGAYGLSDGSLIVAIYGGDDNYAMKLTPALRKEKACTPEDAQISPLLYAVRHPGSDLSTAMSETSLWKKGPQPLTAAEQQKLQSSPPINEDRPPAVTEDGAEPKPAKWRGRPVFAFPWIGAEDALGPQIGLVSIPLMDHMQNETVRATFLYGPASHFPYQELRFTSTRFTPTWNVIVYRQQTYNGPYTIRASNESGTMYLDEKGARVEMNLEGRALGGAASLDAGFKYAHLKPYIGPSLMRHGFLAEPNLGLGLAWQLGSYTWSNSVQGRIAPASLNEEFDYNQVGVSTAVSRPLWWASRLTLGLEGSRTRGKERRELKEVYRPLKTFVPGSGGGYNQNSYSLRGDDAGLFGATYGDTQARAKASWTVPLIPSIDKEIWILYVERLDFTAYYNYGSAWVGTEPRRGWDHLTRAHGYNLDLQFENKGVRFNLGLGTGQVVGREFELYATAGFDALF